jgi:DNA topoisomerase-1
MANRLIIVESPSKARTLGKFLGNGYTIKASMGHVRDLPERGLGVDIEHAFRPEYEVTKEKAIKELRAAVKIADSVLLASDPDREGEAIAWHLAQALKLRDPDRVVFHEITKAAVEAALGSPRKIDRDLVYAQEARRVIDRLVGYQLSPLLWKKVSGGGRRRLSAGRVQSVAVRLVVDREREIDAFVSEESWTVDALLRTDRDEELTARLYARKGEADEDEDVAPGADDAKPRKDDTKLVLTDEASALEIMQKLGVDAEGKPGPDAPPFIVGAIVAKQRMSNPPAPYTTSTLQQEASNRLRYSPTKTMRIAQQLYEGMDLGAEGPVGLITYMRTDSTRISPTARDAAVAHISAAYGKQYVGSGAVRAPRKAAAVEAQDAHEAIRPTDPSRTPEAVHPFLNEEQRRVYDLIWRRFTASQMAAARFDTTRVDIEAGDFVFRATGSVLRFDGFLRVLRRDADPDDRSLPALANDERLALTELHREQHFTQPPPRYTEASLIKELEERGIGRPSTYATIVDTIQERQYVTQEERRLHPTALGVTVDGVLRLHFADVVDIDFTADLEKRLDSIEDGTRGFEPTVREWYEGFSRDLTKAEEGMERVRVPAKPTGETCPECGEGELVIRESRYGEFVGCSRYPDCKYVRKEAAAQPEPTGEECPQCGRELVLRQSKRGPFTGCSGYPDCDYIKRDTAAAGEGPAEDLGTCPNCGKPLGRKMSRRGPFVGCTGYPGCKYIQPRARGEGQAATSSRPAPQPIDRACPDCGKPLLIRTGRNGAFVGCSGYPKCRHTEGDAPELAQVAVATPVLAAAGVGGPGPADAPARAGRPAAAPLPELGPCPDCGKELVRRQGRFGEFVSCSGYPGCKYRPPKGGAAA